MPTTPLGIWYPGSSDDVTPLETTFSTMASSIDNILAGNVQIHRVDNTTQRNALVSQFPPSAENPLFVWRADATNGQELEYTKNGTTWHYVSTSEDDTGWVAITPAPGFTSTGAQVRRIGRVVYLRGLLDGTVSTGVQNHIGTVPVGYRPGGGADSAIGAVHVAAFSNNTFWATVSGAGEIRVIPTASGTYLMRLKGLSGYLVD